MTTAGFEKLVRDGFGKGADAILAAYPHATDAQAAKSGRDIFRESTFAWHTWAWALLQTEKGKGRAYVYYFDHPMPQSPNGAGHGSEIAYVFRTLGRPGATFGPPVATRPEDTAMSELMSTYWTNFAKAADPNGVGLPLWPAFSPSDQRVMYFDAHSSGRPVPNIAQIKALDAYYVWRRQEAKKETNATR
jgi:para-nitrobenzyl esterase